MSSLTEAQQARLFLATRDSINSWLISRKRKHFSEYAGEDPVLLAERASFVTLTIQDQLRGCVGSIIPFQPLIWDVSQNAFHAAFEDTRFLPLTLQETKYTTIEISLLTKPVLIQAEDWDELSSQLHPGVDGVIIQKGGYQATFLPQVWESLPDKDHFLEALCQKAGLPRNAYKTQTNQMSIYLYQAEILNEITPPSLR